MRFWADEPLEQWIWLKVEPIHLHKAPYCVMVGDHVRARYTTEAEAETLITRLKAAFNRTQ